MNFNTKCRILIISIVYLSGDTLINVAQCLSDKFKQPKKFHNNFADSTFSAFKEVYSPISLDVGSPNLVPPEFLRNSLSEVARSSNSSYHQYADAQGIDQLMEEIALLYSNLTNRKLDAKENVLVTVGATEALYLTLQAYTSPGDEWILMDPMFYMYSVMLKVTGGTAKYVGIRPNSEGVTNSGDWTFDRDEMTKAFSNKTKGIIVNNPHNPTGKVFTEEELRFIADLANKWDVLVIIDEVYECLLYDSNQMFRMATLSDEIFERSVMVNSISKSFVATGWRLGWAIAPAEIIKNLKKFQLVMIFSHSVPIQIAAAEGLRRRTLELGQSDSFALNFAKSAEAKRDQIVDVLVKIGASPIIPQSGFFVFVNFTALESKATGLENETAELRDYRFVNWLVKKVGVRLLPGTSFFDRKEKFGEDFVRLCFLMKNETIEEASQLLLDWFL